MSAGGALPAAEEIESLDTKKIGWGAKHNGHEQPNIAAATKAMFKKYNTIYIGAPDEAVLYLTFDEGYENGYTASILDTLKDNGVSAAFFITGHYLDSQPELVERMLEEGHIVGNHTVRHTSFPDDAREELEAEILGLEAAFKEKTGRELAKYVRPPMGEYSEKTLALTAGLGCRTVLWSFGYLDYDEAKSQGDDYAYSLITENLHNGELLLLHATSKENAAVLDSVIKRAKESGFSFGTLDSLEP
jgi:peptidoglycan-N-acetylmuramic acid deacetylase